MSNEITKITLNISWAKFVVPDAKTIRCWVPLNDSNMVTRNFVFVGLIYPQ